MILFLALPRRDTKPIAKALLARFGSFANAIAAPLVELRAIEHMKESGPAALKAVHAAALRLAKAELVTRPLLNNWDRLMAYLNAVMARERVEQFRVLFLDTRNRLLGDEAQARGTVNHTPVYPREVVKRALELQATALILVHNHPSGDPTPSRGGHRDDPRSPPGRRRAEHRAARPRHRRQRQMAELPARGPAVGGGLGDAVARPLVAQATRGKNSPAGSSRNSFIGQASPAGNATSNRPAASPRTMRAAASLRFKHATASENDYGRSCGCARSPD